MRKIKYFFLLILLFLSIAKAQQPYSYPLEVGDYTEFSAFDRNWAKITLIREVIKDTIMQNGYTYKMVKWCTCTNTVNIEPVYEYQRKDLNERVYIYYKEKDTLLFDFSYSTGTLYPSPYEEFNWLVLWNNDYNYQLRLIDKKGNFKGEIYFEGTNIVYFDGRYSDKLSLHEVRYWGSIINGIEAGSGNLIKNTPLESFYPLNIGDRFYYLYGTGNSVRGFIIREVQGDTTLQDGYSYTKIYNEYINIDPLNPIIEYERINDSGTVFVSDGYSIEVKYKFTLCLGDTFYGKTFYHYNNQSWRLYDKNTPNDWLNFGDDITNSQILVARDYGILLCAYEEINEGISLKGAIINGELLGDTSTVITTVDENNTIRNYILSQNYPNPFNPTTQINYSLKESNFVILKVYNSIGELVTTLVNEEKPAGSYSVTFDASELPSGIYFYRIISGSFNETRKMILLK